MISLSERARWIEIARGDCPADLVLKDGHVVSVFTDEVFPADIAIAGGHVVGVGDYHGVQEIDVSDHFLVPGFIDGHCHIESSKLDVAEFAKVVLKNGTTTVIVDPHEMANVLGIPGVEYILDCSEGIPLDVFVMMPSCVPASRFETCLTPLDASDFTEPLTHPRVIGIAEMMNYPAVIAADPSALEKLALTAWERIDGHAPGLSGHNLNGYVVAGPNTDHECITYEEALEKRRLGMWVMIREASMIRNLEDLLPLVKRHGTENTLFVTDDREADTLLHEGHINSMVRTAVSSGLPAPAAVRLASLNVARCHRLANLGAIAPGYMADISVLPDLERFDPVIVLKKGLVVMEDGRVAEFKRPTSRHQVRDSVRIPDVESLNFAVKASAKHVNIPLVELIPDQVATKAGSAEVTTSNGYVVAQADQDIAKLAVVERHHASGAIGLGFVRGFGLKRGAFASTVAHDAHNVVVVGINDDDMREAVRRLGTMGGGLVVVENGRILGELALPIAGLMSDRPAEEVDIAIRELESKLGELGVTIGTPFMYVSFLALSVIPELRVTDQGIVDVSRFEIVAPVSPP